MHLNCPENTFNCLHYVSRLLFDFFNRSFNSPLRTQNQVETQKICFRLLILIVFSLCFFSRTTRIDYMKVFGTLLGKHVTAGPCCATNTL